MKLNIATTVILAALASPLIAQPLTPEDAARGYFLALKEHGASEVADHMHPAELVRFKEMLLPIYQAEFDSGRSELRDATFGKESTLADVKKSDPKLFMSNFMKAIGAWTGVQPTFDAVEVLGIVPEDQLMHVVTRVKVGSAPITITKMEVVTLKSYEGRWMLMLSGQFEGVAQALSSRAKGR
jgi:hypothetical protein